MHTKLTLPSNETIKICVDIKMKVKLLKEQIKKYYSINDDIELSCDGMNLIDEISLHENHIWPDSKIILSIKRYNILNPDAPIFHIYHQ